MNQINQNINKDMIDFDLIDVESLDFSDEQTWLCTLPDDSGRKVDIIEFKLSCDWPVNEDEEYLNTEKKLYAILDNVLKNVDADDIATPDRHKFDSRTYVKPKRRPQRPSIQSIVEVASNPPSMSPHHSLNQTNNINQTNSTNQTKYLTYNKYSNPLGPISPMLRLKTFNVDVNTDNSHVVKEFAMKRRSQAPDDDPQLEDELDMQSDAERLTSDQSRFKPIKVDFTQPMNNFNTFNKGLTNMMNERGSLNMYQSGESLMRMSPPSLVSSLVMENSGNFNMESLEGKKSLPPQKDLGVPMSGRNSIDPMMTSMTLSILDEKDMSTSFLSQTTYPDNDSLIDSLPPSLVSSVNSSYIISNSSRAKADPEPNIFSSATFTNLEQSERLLTARPRCQLYNSFKRDSIRNSESYTKAREEACQIDTGKVLNENCDNVTLQTKDSPKRQNGEMSETITLHYSNNKFRRDIDAEKENMNSTFEKDDAFFNEMDVQRPVEQGKNSMNVTLDKQELNEIIQARQKLSLARKALPTEPDKPLPNQVDASPIKTIQLPNQTITVPRQSMENASELLSRRKALNRDEPPPRETPKRNATFKKASPKMNPNAMDATVVYVKSNETNIIDINSATMNLIDNEDRTLQQEEWDLEQRAMVGSSESTDTGTFSSSSPPDLIDHPRLSVASTPLMSIRKGSKNELMNLHSTISPIYDVIDDKSYTMTKAPSTNNMERTYDMNTTVINSATLVKKSSAKRDILAPKSSPDKKIPSPVHVRSPPGKVAPNYAMPATSTTIMPPPSTVPKKTNLPTSKLRQYSSHKELNRIPGNIPQSRALGRTMVRRGVYASNPALSPTAAAPAPTRRESVVLPPTQSEHGEVHVDKLSRGALTAPPALVRQATETLRRERPHAHIVPPKDLRLCAGGAGVVMRNQYAIPPTTRPHSLAGSSQLRVSRPTSVPSQRPAPGDYFQ
ncbi:uncharacterized protein LOC119837261 [Zerene cesonia]|uniref:uncharacterized protein LOC119837261 n=1 Tax=Zerene cesonia TaxID=33412 RepID=UPI0018E4EEA0|nr:uncharacterized protein LOC119837261 [Zerene cesonia]